MKTKNIKAPVMIPAEKIHPFEGNPFKVTDNDEMNELIQSITENGILEPLTVRPIENTDGEYEIIAGHRRYRAAQKAGLTEVPAFIRAVSRDEAAVMLVDSNLHRERILPSEKAFAYKLKMEALEHQGKTCGQVGHKSRDEVSETDSGRQVQRYIRLTNLIPELLDMMDEGKIAFSVGVELSFLDDQLQYDVLNACELNDNTPSYAQAVRMHKSYNADALDADGINTLMSQEKANQKEKLTIPMESLKGRIPGGYTEKQMQEYILKACDYYQRYLRRQREDSEVI